MPRKNGVIYGDIWRMFYFLARHLILIEGQSSKGAVYIELSQVIPLRQIAD